MIRKFKNEEYGQVRTTLINNEPYFCLVDVARAFDISDSNVCREIIPSKDIQSVEIVNEKNKENKLFIKKEHISTLLYRSKKKNAELVNNWLYATVLPQLINQLEYNIDDFKDPNKLVGLIESNNDLRIRNTVLETINKLNEPKVKAMDKIVGSSKCYDIDVVNRVVKYPNISPADLIKILRVTGVLDETNRPYQEYCDKRYFRVVESRSVEKGAMMTSTRTYVYNSGVNFINKILGEYEINK